MILWGIIEDFSWEAPSHTSGAAAAGYLYTEPRERRPVWEEPPLKISAPADVIHYSVCCSIKTGGYYISADTTCWNISHRHGRRRASHLPENRRIAELQWRLSAAERSFPLLSWKRVELGSGVFVVGQSFRWHLQAGMEVEGARDGGGCGVGRTWKGRRGWKTVWGILVEGSREVELRQVVKNRPSCEVWTLFYQH